MQTNLLVNSSFESLYCKRHRCHSFIRIRNKQALTRLFGSHQKSQVKEKRSLIKVK